LETIILNKTDLRRSKKIPNINSLGINKYIIDCNISNSHLYKDYDQNISKIHKLKLDLIIRCGTGIFKGQILNAAKYGILSSHHGDNRYYRGGPGGFWEVYNNSAESGFVIQNLNEKLDAGDVLARNNYATEKLWFLNKYKLQKECNKAWVILLDYIYKHKKLPEKENEIIGFVKINKFPNNIVFFKYFIKKSLYQFIKFFLSKNKTII
jgi:methionyl-tRNA formyltransferase